MRAFVAAWVRARLSFLRRVVWDASVGCLGVGAVLLVACVLWWTAQWGVAPADLAYWAVFAAAGIGWQLRRGVSGRAGAGPSRFSPVGRPAGDGPLFMVPLWVPPVLLLPGVPYVGADVRARWSGGGGA